MVMAEMHAHLAFQRLDSHPNQNLFIFSLSYLDSFAVGSPSQIWHQSQAFFSQIYSVRHWPYRVPSLGHDDAARFATVN